MAKSISVPCSLCQKPMKTTVTDGTQACHPCRRVRAEGFRECVECGASYKWGRSTRCNPCSYSAEKERARVAGRFCSECSEPATTAGLCRTHYSYRHRATNGRRDKETPEQRRARQREAYGKLTYAKSCAFCGNEFATANKKRKTCTKECSIYLAYGYSRSKDLVLWNPEMHLVHKPAPKDRRGPLRKAYEDGDMGGMLEAIKARCIISDSGCWEWQGQSKDGYGKVKFGKKFHAVHRLSALARYGQPESEPVVHHQCANRICCNPDHLQPVSHRENLAEMLERNYYLKRIAELEAALSSVDPGNVLLAA